MDRREPLPTLRRTTGQGVVEMAFVLPIVLVLALSLMEFAWMYYNIAALQFASHEGARYGAVGRTNEEVISKVNESMWGMTVTTIEITVKNVDGSIITSSDRTVGKGNQLIVRGRIAYAYLTPLPQIVAGSGAVRELIGQTTVMIEGNKPQ